MHQILCIKGIQRRLELSEWVLWDEPSGVKSEGAGQIKAGLEGGGAGIAAGGRL